MNHNQIWQRLMTQICLAKCSRLVPTNLVDLIEKNPVSKKAFVVFVNLMFNARRLVFIIFIIHLSVKSVTVIQTVEGRPIKRFSALWNDSIN